jgi:hypothetical protein
MDGVLAMAKCDKCGEEESFECGSCEMDRHINAVVKAAESADPLVSTLAKKHIEDMLRPIPFLRSRKT